MTIPSEKLHIIHKSTTVPGYIGRVAYDKDHNLPFGYWVCTECHRRFFHRVSPIHNSDCSQKDRTVGLYKYKDLVYVLGPKESGARSPFVEEHIELIKELAKTTLKAKALRELAETTLKAKL
jgi:hypothetical protein